MPAARPQLLFARVRMEQNLIQIRQHLPNVIRQQWFRWKNLLQVPSHLTRKPVDRQSGSILLSQKIGTKPFLRKASWLALASSHQISCLLALYSSMCASWNWEGFRFEHSALNSFLHEKHMPPQGYTMQFLAWIMVCSGGTNHCWAIFGSHIVRTKTKQTC